MRTRLIHPLWTHIPAVAVFIALIIYIASTGSLPDEVPLHFNVAGIPDSYGSPLIAIGIIIGLSVFYILLSVFLDELWARQENAKSFVRIIKPLPHGIIAPIRRDSAETPDHGTVCPLEYCLRRTFCDVSPHQFQATRHRAAHVVENAVSRHRDTPLTPPAYVQPMLLPGIELDNHEFHLVGLGQ